METNLKKAATIKITLLLIPCSNKQTKTKKNWNPSLPKNSLLKKKIIAQNHIVISTPCSRSFYLLYVVELKKTLCYFFLHCEKKK